MEIVKGETKLDSFEAVIDKPETEAQKKNLFMQTEEVKAKMIANENSVLDHGAFGLKALKEKYDEAKRLGDILQWLQGILYNRFTFPEQVAAQQEEAKKNNKKGSGIITL